MRHIEVIYRNDTHAFVDDYCLEALIKSKMIKKFFRPSERQWITIGVGPLRSGQGGYRGVERRRTGNFDLMMPLPNGQAKNRPVI
jgi:hypothetical protein